MKVSDFDFTLPRDRIATHPVSPRDAARLLHVSEQLTDYQVRDLPALLQPGDVMVFNDSKVIPARLFFGAVEVLLHQRREDGTWLAFARPAKKLKDGMDITFAADFTARVEGRMPDGQIILRFKDSERVVFEKLYRYGHTPLPPYIDRADTETDIANYQTIYAREEGSVAAPTAGLHFTEALFKALDARGVKRVFVTLHVGAGTFQPVKVEDISDHIMHREWAEITDETARAINEAKRAGGKVVAVGTTSLRILETVADGQGQLRAWSGETGIFITPGYRFRIVDRLMTNFHLPKSTLFMLVAAFSGLERIHAAYAHAIANVYRFYSYGDASLLDREKNVTPA